MSGIFNDLKLIEIVWRPKSLQHVSRRVPQLTCTWMSLPGATGLGKLTSVEGKISGDLDSDFDLTHLEDKIRAQRIKD